MEPTTELSGWSATGGEKETLGDFLSSLGTDGYDETLRKEVRVRASACECARACVQVSVRPSPCASDLTLTNQPVARHAVAQPQLATGC